MISTVVKLSALDDEEKLNLKNNGLRIAFNAENTQTREVINDTRYIRYIAFLNGSRNGEEFEAPLKFHVCSESELRDFATPTKQAKL